MDSKELRESALVAGLEVSDIDDDGDWVFSIPGTTELYSGHGSMVPAYFASLLVALVRESGKRAMHQFNVELCDTNPLLINDEQRIRAAMEVLGDG